ncbi:retrovirus-related pol polyprotein from transposon TNT 1-94 [Tanacetum coccineum]
MRPFGCPVTILNTIDHLGKFDGKADEGFFVGYSTNSKTFKVFNSRTRIVEENLHVQFSENTPNITRSGPNWLFDIDAQTKSMNYKPVVAGNQSNGNVGTKACNDAGKARMETVPGKDYILLPMWPADPLFSQNLKDSPDARFKPSWRRKILDIDADEDITLDSTYVDTDPDMFGVHDLHGDEVFVEIEEPVVNAATTTTTTATTTVADEVEMTLAQTLIKIKSAKPKAKGIVRKEPSESTPTISSQQHSQVKGQGSKDKGKEKMIEPEKPLKKKDQIMYDQEVALNIQA